MSRSRIAAVRRACYRTAVVLGDVQAVDKAAHTRSVRPLAARAARKNLWRTAARLLRSLDGTA